jgi:hypothetical protein
MSGTHVLDDSNYNILTLAPHQRAPIINFGLVKTDHRIEKVLVIKNPQQFQVKLNVTYQGGIMNEKNKNQLTLVIEKNSQIDFKIKWSPVEPGNHKYTILFVSQSLTKFHVSCYGDCSASTFKRTVSARRPLGQLQINGQKSFHSSYSNIHAKQVSPSASHSLDKENKSPTASYEKNKPTNTLLFEVNPIYKCDYLEMKKTSSLDDQNNKENDEPIKRKFLVESIYNVPNKRKLQSDQQLGEKKQPFAIYSAMQ